MPLLGRNEERVVGIITEGDLLQRAAESERGGILQALASRAPLRVYRTM